MNAALQPNLVGITGITRRLVMDGALDAEKARAAQEGAAKAKRPIAQWLLEEKLVTPAQLTAANAVEFGLPVFDPATMPPQPETLKLVSEELVQKHHVLPLFKRGNKLFLGTSQPTQTAALAEIQFHTNLVVEPILVDEDQIRRTLEQWQNAGGQISGDLGGDDEGLDNLDRRILSVIAEKFGGGPVGIETLAVAVSEEADTLTDVIEPFLMQGGFLKRTTRGRVITAKAAAHMGFKLPRQAELL